MGKPEFINRITEHAVGFLKDEPMSKHTTFKIGGNADIFLLPENEEQLCFCIKTAKEEHVPYFVLGNGSDLLVSDNGIEGAVISLVNLKGIDIAGTAVTVKAGENLASLCMSLKNAGLTGLEFAYGIPASVGGAVYMNAGAYGGEIKDCIVSAKYLDQDGEIKEIGKEDMCLSYRNSVFKKNRGIILSAVFELKEDCPEKILERMNEYMARRKEKQPLEFPSAGSTFKRPENNFAGTLIEKSGLKGEKVGGAEVSRKHAGFIINTGGATSKDVRILIKKIQSKVFADSGVNLEPEIIYVGR